MIEIKWVVDSAGDTLCAVDCSFWFVCDEECSAGWEVGEGDFGVPGPECPGPGMYTLTRKET